MVYGNCEQYIRATLPCCLTLYSTFYSTLYSTHSSNPQVTIIFIEVCGFTAISQQLHPRAIMLFLNQLYARFDEAFEHCGVYKVRSPHCMQLAVENAEGSITSCPAAAGESANALLGCG